MQVWSKVVSGWIAEWTTPRPNLTSTFIETCHDQQVICSLIWEARYAHVEYCSARLQLYVQVVRVVGGRWNIDQITGFCCHRAVIRRNHWVMKRQAVEYVSAISQPRVNKAGRTLVIATAVLQGAGKPPACKEGIKNNEFRCLPSYTKITQVLINLLKSFVT